MRVQHAIITEIDIRADDAVGANADIPSQRGEWRNNGSWMDHGCYFRRRNAALTRFFSQLMKCRESGGWFSESPMSVHSTAIGRTERQYAFRYHGA